MKHESPTEILSNALYQGGMKLVIRVSQIIFISYLFIAAIGFFSGNYDRDDTDGQNRSGLKPYTDHLTGCQYLSTINGNLTPRLAFNKQHYGCKQ